MPAELRGRELVLATGGIMLALFLAALDQTIVGTAMPRIVADLRGLELYAWVVTAYMVASTTMVPIAGKLGDLFGRKPFLIGGMSGFVLASALCGLAQDMPQLIVFRGVQGLFGGVLLATVFTVIADLYPPKRRVRMQGLFGGVWAVASIVGPVVGGYLTDGLGWRSVFYVNVPVGGIAIAAVVLTIPFVRTPASWRDIDVVGAALLAAGLVPLLTALSITRDHTWLSPEVAGLLLIAATALGLFFVVERRAERGGEHPIVPFSLFRNRTFAVSILAGFLVGFGMFGTMVFVQLLFQGALGLRAAIAGQLVAPMMLGFIVGSVVSGQVIARVRRYRFVGTVGIATVIAGMLSLSRTTPATPPLEAVRDIVVIGLGIGSTMPLYVNAVQSALPRAVVGVATSQMQFWRNVGGTLGVAILGSLLAQRLPVRLAEAAPGLPGSALPLASGTRDPEALFDPQRLDALRAALPAERLQLFEEALSSMRDALATTLGELFIYGAAIIAVALVASVFLDDVPLRDREAPREREAAAPVFGE